MILLTQIDYEDKKFEEDPHFEGGNLSELIQRIANDTTLTRNDIKPIVNYVNVSERTWHLDKAAFIPINHCVSLVQDLNNGDN